MMLDDKPEVWQGMLSLLEADQEEGIYLWGAGYHGRTMCAYIESNGVKIKGIIDTNKHGANLGKYVILSPEQITGDSRVFISITDRHAVKSIKSKMQEKHSEIKLADYYELRKMIK